MPRRPVLLLVSFLAVLLTACPSSSVDPSPGEPLAPGETVEGVDGVAIAAPEGALADTVTVIIERFEQDATVPALDVPTIGRSYRIAATDAVRTPLENPLLLALPSVEGVDPASLQMAIHVHGPDGQGNDHLSGWMPVDAYYDPDSGLMAAPVYGLVQNGMVATLIEAETTGPADGIAPQVETVGNFAARCSRFEDADCTPQEEQTLAQTADAFFRDLVTERGFASPYLEPHFEAGVSVSVFPPSFSASARARYLIQLKPEDTTWCKDDVNGKYIGPLAKAVICLPEDPADNADLEAQQTTMHEVFHAIQYNYGTVVWDSINGGDEWVIEGTATAAERSRDQMEVDQQRSARRVEFAVTDDSDTNAYRLQDFWVFVGRQGGWGVEYLRAVLSGGLAVQEVDATLKELFNPGYGLREAHWDWVKNQTFESRIDIGVDGNGNAIVNDPCIFNTRTTANVGTRTFDPGQPGGDFINEVFSVSPLGARVRKIDFRGQPNDGYQATIDATLLDAVPLAVKVYQDVSSATTACHGDPEGLPYTVSVPQGQDVSVYVLVASGQLDSVKNVDAIDWPRPAIQVTAEMLDLVITSPSDGARFEEGTSIFFEAEATGPNDPGRVSWSTDTGHQIVSIGRFEGQSDLSDSFCPGNHEITAEVSDEAGITSTDAITIAVDNLTPEVSITSNAVIGEGNYLSLDGHVDDPTCDREAGNGTSEWLLGGNPVATGNELRAERVTTPAGESLTVEFRHDDPWGESGTAVQTYTVQPAPAGGWPPQAEIRSVRQDQFTDPDEVNLTLSGTGLDAEDGPRAGAALQWFVEDLPVGEGTEVTLRLADHVPVDLGKRYDVRLEVTDSDGNEASDETTYQVDVAQ